MQFSGGILCDKNCTSCETVNGCSTRYVDVWPKPFAQNYTIPSRSELRETVKPDQSKGSDFLGLILTALPFI